jgi:hypothetical protein
MVMQQQNRINLPTAAPDASAAAACVLPLLMLSRLAKVAHVALVSQPHTCQTPYLAQLLPLLAALQV